MNAIILFCSGSPASGDSVKPGDGQKVEVDLLLDLWIISGRSTRFSNSQLTNNAESEKVPSPLALEVGGGEFWVEMTVEFGGNDLILVTIATFLHLKAIMLYLATFDTSQSWSKKINKKAVHGTSQEICQPDVSKTKQKIM